MPCVKNEYGSAAFEFIFFALCAAFFLCLVMKYFYIFKSSLGLEIALNSSIEKKLEELNWPVCIEDYFDQEILSRTDLKAGHFIEKKLALFVNPICIPSPTPSPLPALSEVEG